MMACYLFKVSMPITIRSCTTNSFRSSTLQLHFLATQHETSSCLPNTRVSLLEQIYNWADGTDERYIFWLNGFAGTGKSTVARTVARRYFDQKRLGASFFFARGGGDLGNAGKFVTSIATQLANSVRAIRRHISAAISEHSDISSLSLSDQW
jgi:hypothetical protein